MKKSDKEEFKDYSQDLFNHGKEYLEIQKELIKLEITERSAKYVGRTLTALVLSLMLYLVLLMASFALAFYLGAVYNSLWIGFGYVTLGYAAVFLIFFIFRKYFLRIPFINTVIKHLINP